MDRKKQILAAIIKEHVATGSPVGSSNLVEKYKLDCSSATVRNIMAELEEDGFIRQPHTSAGRVPTEAAYRYFIEHLAHHRPAAEEGRGFSDVFADRARAVAAAKALAAKTHECVFVSFGRDDVYVTGLSNLFAKPEFVEREIAMNLTAALDQLDQMVGRLCAGAGAQLLIGEENPLDSHCATVYLAPTEGRRVGVLGLMRMDYEKILNLLDSIKF